VTVKDASAPPTTFVAVTLAVLASFLWATSFIYIKIGLEDMPPLTFAALRYVIGAIALAMFRLGRPPATDRRLDAKTAWLLVALGLLLYALIPAFMFLGLDRAEAVSFNFVFQAGIPLMLAVTAGYILKEATSWWEWVGVAIVIGGTYVFFPALPTGDELIGVVLAAIAAISIGASNLIQRRVMRSGRISSIDATMLPMGLGSVLLLLYALVVEDFPTLDGTSIVLLLVLGVINTAFAFTIWHSAMMTLNALHAGVIASAQIVEVAVLAWWFLGENLGAGRIAGSVIVVAGIVVVHVSKARAARILSGDDAEAPAIV
jgi:drug/metabolite transporter (DMT)-like permease